MSAVTLQMESLFLQRNLPIFGFAEKQTRLKSNENSSWFGGPEEKLLKVSEISPTFKLREEAT